MNAKTSVILLAAGGLIAAAAVLSHQGRSAASAAEAPPTDPSVPPERPKEPVAEASVCETTGTSARDRADFGGGAMTAALSGSQLLQGGDGEMYMAVELDVDELQAVSRPPLNLAIVIDRSGSMQGDPLASAKNAALGIVDRLSDRDRVALAQYDDAAQVVVPSTAMDSAGRARMREAIGSIRTGGSTNLHGGMVLGRDEVKKELVPGSVNRVILLSDGQANAGVTDPAVIARDASLAADRGVRITAVGLGLSYNEDLMEAIAEAGRGNYYYVQDASTLAKVFSGELENLQATVATNAELRLDPACDGVKIEDVFGYQPRRSGDSVSIPLADLAGGDARKVVAKLRAPASAAGALNLVRATLSFDDVRSGDRTSTDIVLAATVTGDADAVRASADKDVVAQVVEVESARVMREAAIAYDRGDVSAASAALSRGRSALRQKAQQYDLEEEQAAPAMENLGRMADSVGRYAPGSAEGRAAVKGSKRDARKMSKNN